MKKYIYILFILFTKNINSQSCVTGEFYGQDEIDNFPILYPDCSVIDGDLSIIAINGISSLEPLSQIKEITGSLTIRFASLSSLDGLNNLIRVGEDLRITENIGFLSLVGLDSLTTIGRNFQVTDNDGLNSLEGVQNISQINGDCYIGSNSSLVELTEFENLSKIGGYLFISNNNLLENLKGFENLVEIGGNLDVSDNENISTLEGLQNLVQINGSLHISGNSSLFHLIGLENLITIGENLELSDSYLFNLNSLEKLERINNSLSLWGCHNLKNLETPNSLQYLGGSLRILFNDSLHAVSKLVGIDTLYGNLNILGNTLLNDLSGFDELEAVGGYLSIYNNSSLLNLEGLNGIKSLGGYLTISKNDELEGIIELVNLNSINGYIDISENIALTSLDGIQNIDAFTVFSQNQAKRDITIFDNPNLSDCSIKSICEILEVSEKTFEIGNNFHNCNSKEEILDNCSTTSIDSEAVGDLMFNISPNPTTDLINIHLSKAINSKVRIEILDFKGNILRRLGFELAPDILNLDVSDLAEGVYIMSISTENESTFRKVLISN